METEELKALSSQMKENIARIRENMSAACREAGRKPEEVLLCAASKTRDSETVRLSAALDIDIFGENHVQELVAKTADHAYLGKPHHLIGHLQTNKVRQTVGIADMIQSVDSLKILEAIEKEAAKKDLVQDVLLEINIGAEENKTGADIDLLYPMLERAEELSHIHVRGLMTVPPAGLDDDANRRILASMYKIFEEVKSKHYDHSVMEFLSMGMSSDYENAIREGANIVRIGTSIYGARYYPDRTV